MLRKACNCLNIEHSEEDVRVPRHIREARILLLEHITRAFLLRHSSTRSSKHKVSEVQYNETSSDEETSTGCLQAIATIGDLPQRTNFGRVSPPF